MTPIAHCFSYGSQKIILETGCVAKQTNASVMVQAGDTVVLVTVTLGKEPIIRPKFVPLAVHYQEKSYAAGKIPGNFFRRETRPSEGEILTARLIDRSLRPLISKHFSREIQIVATVLSVDPQVHPDIPAMIGAGAALHISSVAFEGPVISSRLGYVDDQWIINPSTDQREKSGFDLVLSSNRAGMVMVEASAKEFPESEIFGALQSAHTFHQKMLQEIEAFGDKVAQYSYKKEKLHGCSEQLEAAEIFFNENVEWIRQQYQQWLALSDKNEREQHAHELHASIKSKVIQFLSDRQFNESSSAVEEEVYHLSANLKRDLIRTQILTQRSRADGRSPEAVRALDIRVGILPKTHGSCLFTRGGTQALATVTLGNEKDAQQVDDLVGNKNEQFLLHYNFPPFSVGEVGILSSPKRREIGHGNLAKRALSSLLPSSETFPYVIRVVSEIMESDGSSSMATVCAASLALMDAGVALNNAVAGVAMGLIMESQQEWVVLSDISALEDHLGDMDFKVAGTVKGITALQMDVKVPGISGAMLEAALLQAKAARLHILNIMNEAKPQASQSLSALVPKYYRVQIPVMKIKDLVGKGGAVVKRLSSEFNATIDIADSGLVKFCTASEKDAAALEKKILQLVGDLEIGAIYLGKVNRIEAFGAFVELIPCGKNGLIHISELTQARVAKVTDCVNIGDVVSVRLLAVDAKTGRMRFSMKSVSEGSESLPSSRGTPDKKELKEDVSSISTTDDENFDDVVE